MGCGPFAFVCDAAGGAVKGVASSGFDSIAQSFGEAAKTMCDWMWSAISTTTTVDLDGGWFHSDLAITAALAGVMVAGLFVLQVIKGALQRDPLTLTRAVTGCGIAFIGAAAAITVTQLLLVLTDKLSDGIVRTAGQGDLASLGQKLTPVASLAGTGSAFTPALIVALSFFFILASVLVWAVFLIRKAMIIVAAVFAPIAFGGAASDATRSWVRKWIEFTLAMVFSKLVIVLIFTLAISLIGQSGPGVHGLSTLMTGLMMLVLACFAPWMVLRLVHFIGGDIAAAHHGAMINDTRAAASTAVGATSQMRGSAQKVLGGSGSGSAAAGSATAGAAAPVAVGAAAASKLATAPTAAAQKVGAAVDATGLHSSPASNGVAQPATRSSGPPPTRPLARQANWGDAT